MGKKNRDNTHGQNSIEAAADKTMGGVNALKEQVQEANKFPRSEGGGLVRGQESVAESAAGALGAVIPEANKEEVEQTASSGGKGPPQTAGEIVDRANRAIDAGKGPPKNGGVSGSEAGSAADSLYAGVRERAELTAQRLSELSGDAKESLQQKAGEAREGARNAEQRAEEGGREAKERVSRGADEAAERAKNGVESVKEGAERLGQRAAEKGREVKEAVVGGQGSEDTEGLDKGSLERAKLQAHENANAKLSKGLNRPEDRPAPPKYGSARSDAAASAKSAKEDAKGAARSAKENIKGATRSAKDEAKGAADAVTDSVKSAYRDAKDAVSDTYHQAEDKARSALDSLKDRMERLDAEMHPDNFVDYSLSTGHIPSNTEEVLAAQGRK